MNNCAESQTKVCKAYMTDMYVNILKSYTRCVPNERYILKANILEMLDKTKTLIENQSKN